MKRINKQLQKGFTLLELLVVVSILAIIAGAVISAISGQEERAGQGVALNTMGALENATQQHIVINRGLPSGLDSLMCGNVNGSTEANDVSVLAPAGLTVGTDTALLPTLADGLSGKLLAVNIPATSGTDCEDEFEGACALTENGITRLRYAANEACNETEGETFTVNNVTVDEEAMSEVLANRLFLDGGIEGGAGLNLQTGDGTVAIPIAILTDPTEAGQPLNTIIGVFGVGDQSSFVDAPNNGAKLLARGPIDGNVEGNGERYSHFSLAIKLGEVTDNTAPSQAEIDSSAAWEGDEIGIVAVLDSDGDYYGDEIAEFRGLEDE